MRTSVIERYLKFFINISHIIVENALFPTDASIVAIMIKNNIKKIITDDSDFKKVGLIEVIEV